MSAQLYHGDCLEILQTLEAGHVDVVITDPPYGQGQHIVAVGNCPAYEKEYAWNDCAPEDVVFAEMFRVSEHQIIFGANYFPILWQSPCKGFIFWDKIQCSNLHADGELIWTSYPRVAKQYRYCFSGNRYGWPNSIHGVGKPSNRVHPTQKPVDLLAAIINDYTEPGDIILDPFMGSGTTGIACVQTRRNFIGIEIDADYYEMAERRIAEAQQQMRLPL